MNRFISLNKIWLRLKQKSFSLLLRCMVLTTKLFGVPILTTFFQSLALIPGIRTLAAPLWFRTLQRKWLHSEAMDWTKWICERWQFPNFLILHAEALLELKRFDEAANAIKTAKKSLLETDRYKRNYTSIVDHESMLAIERGDVTVEVAFFATGRGRVGEFCYKRAWDAHAVMNSERVSYYLNYYFRVINYEVDTVFYVCDHLLLPNGLWDDMIFCLNQVEARLKNSIEDEDAFSEIYSAPARKKFGGLLQLFTRIQNSRISKKNTEARLRLSRAFLETGRFKEARAILDSEQKQSAYTMYSSGLINLYDSENAKEEKGREQLSVVFADRKLPRQTCCEIAGEIAISYEENCNFSAARQYYVSSFYPGIIPFFLPEYLWRYVSFCMAFDNYAEAAHVMRQGLAQFWPSFRRLAKIPIKRRLRNNQLIPQNGAFFIGCWGIGDDVDRIAMFEALRKSRQGRFGFSVDPRMQALYARSFPDFEFIPISRMSGPFALSEEEYVRLRSSLPPELDRGRVDINVMKAAKRYPETALTEDLLVAFIQGGPKLRYEALPMLKVLPEKQQIARKWLETLPLGLNVGISWRSGKRDMIRNKSYTDLVKEWAPILSVKGINFINLQYSYEEEEPREAEARHGCIIHCMPGVDLKDDIEDVTALATVLDVTLAPGTAVREICAAVGARVWSLTTTPVLADIWRLDEDGESDRLFPNMRHFTVKQFGDTQGVLTEIGRQLEKMVSDHRSNAPHSQSVKRP
jgi:hypothetical protein